MNKRVEEIIVGQRKFWLIEIADSTAQVYRYHVRENDELIFQNAAIVDFETEHDAEVMQIGSARDLAWNNLKDQILNGGLV